MANRRGRRIEKLFDGSVPATERAMWTLMDDEQRDRALQRGAALISYDGGKGGISAANAAVAAGVSLVRFYQMAKKWDAGRSLAALGVGAAPRGVRVKAIRADLDEELERAAAAVVDRDEEASVRQLALDLAEELGARLGPDTKLPKHNTLRLVVERELRRRRRRGRPGEQLLFDNCPIGILRPDGSFYQVYSVIDEATHLVLGAALGDAADGRGGYRAAAADAMVRLHDERLGRLDWAARVARMQLVPAGDGDQALDGVDLFAGAPGLGFNLAKAGTGGRYIVGRVGHQLGVLPVWKSRADNELPSSVERRAPVLEPELAAARLALEVAAHDGEVLAGLSNLEGDGYPGAVLRLLEGFTR